MKTEEELRDALEREMFDVRLRARLPDTEANEYLMREVVRLRLVEAFILRLAKEGGAIVSSAACSELEIAFHRADNDMIVLDALGFCLRPQKFLNRHEEMLQRDSRKYDKPECRKWDLGPGKCGYANCERDAEYLCELDPRAHHGYDIALRLCEEHARPYLKPTVAG